ncbi:hypothetical protein SAMN04487958_10820 [Vreelandella subterranea]|uniref:Uncharacterized protein n=1 Tax=Vreelandella subterranea TaxID=416874 RepID=A0A1H9V120_9GAMM|nr:hypothetical protein [Halomonas subterranea]SES15318.1 hypothetical protein SAMN04487958_10820 [Halomonas subterranea]
MSHLILSHLQANDGATLDELCTSTGLNADAVRHILTGLVNSRFVICLVDRYNRTPKCYAVTSQGHCEWCGLYEHRRVAAMCPRCIDKSSGLESLPNTPMAALPAGLNTPERSQA